MRSPWIRNVLVVSVAAIFAVACGPDDGGTTGGMDTSNGGTDTGPERFEMIDCSSASNATEVQVGPMFKYDPKDVEISAGGVVKWTWPSGLNFKHDVTADDDSDCQSAKPGWFQSDTTDQSGYTFCVRFNETGTWNYQCTVTGHCPQGMKGTVTVE